MSHRSKYISDRSVIHLNVADFAAAVETRLAPGLRGFPLVIAPLGAPRAVVYDMSETAFREGIRKGMPLARARRLHPGLRILPPRFHRYEAVMKDLFRQANAYTPAVESGIRDGHLFLDVTGTGRLHGPPVDVAFNLRKRLKKDTGLTPIWSVATNKLVAKVATRLVKPLGEYIVGPGEEEAFLAPLPVSLIPGLDRDELKVLSGFNLVRVSQVRTLSLDQLTVPFPGRARAIHNLIRGIDADPVFPDRNDQIRADHEFADDTNDGGRIRGTLYTLADRIAVRLRQKGLAARVLSLVLSYSDGIRGRARKTLKPATADDTALYKTAARLLDQARTRRVRIRHLRLVCEKPVPGVVQTLMFGPSQIRRAGLTRVMDRIRDRFGTGAIRTATTLMGETAAPATGDSA